MTELEQAKEILWRILEFSLLEDEDPMHPVGCATWQLEADAIKAEIVDFLGGA